MVAATALCVLALVASPAPAAADAVAGPCDRAVTYLREATPYLRGEPVAEVGRMYQIWEADLERWLADGWGLSSGPVVARVTPACRAEIRRGEATAAVATTRALIVPSAWSRIERGRVVLCAMQDPGALTELDAWMADRESPAARAVCVAALATWPDAEAARRTVLAGAVRQAKDDSWEIDPAIVAAANVMGTSALREQLVPVLTEAHARRAAGYDRLRAALCVDSTMSGNRMRACSTLPAGAEDRWHWNEPKAWIIRGYSTIAYGAAIATSIAARDGPGGRPLATVAGVAGGFMVGDIAAVGGAMAGGLLHDGREPDVGAYLLIAGSSILGGVLGGLAAHALAASPGARVPITVLGFAPLYVLSVATTFD